LAYVFQIDVLNDEAHIVDAGEIAALEWRALTDLPGPMVHDVEAGLEDLRAGRTGVVRVVQRRGTSNAPVVISSRSTMRYAVAEIMALLCPDRAATTSSGTPARSCPEMLAGLPLSAAGPGPGAGGEMPS